jgi:hypothetical protein
VLRAPASLDHPVIVLPRLCWHRFGHASSDAIFQARGSQEQIDGGRGISKTLILSLTAPQCIHPAFQPFNRTRGTFRAMCLLRAPVGKPVARSATEIPRPRRKM